jgi:peptidoglycan/xylan/chitin deacetylase (PgdA/CDA1 family)
MANNLSRARILDIALELMIRGRIFDGARLLNPKALTVLNYHRIDDPFRPGFNTFKLNVSATPESFSQQMAYVKKNYNAITCEHLAAWLDGKIDLPPRALIITFDDGYYDNLAHALPVLKANNLPSVIFLTTDFMGASAPFYWDFVAYCFLFTRRDHADLPAMGLQSWNDESTRDAVMHRWIESVKILPEAEKQQAIQDIADILDVSVPAKAFFDLYLTWDQVRELSQSGVEFGAHTASHPILTRISIEQVREELEKSKKRIEEEIKKPVISFAYPNGQGGDFSPQVIDAVSKAGIKVAFSLLPGPTRYSTVRKNPLQIRRIFLGYHDTFPRFVAKVAGVNRLLGR